MEENRNHQSERISKLVEAINALPANLPNVLCWAIENYFTLEEMAKKSEMTLEDIRAAMETALADRHYATLILLYITKTIKESTENEEF